MADPYTSIGNDATASAPDGPLNLGKPHPRTYGTFPRVLGYYCRELKLFSLEEAIRKMTSLPARMLGINDRGIIKDGAFADLVLFDPYKIKDNATIKDPHRYPSGIEYILVNGKIAAIRGEILPANSGRVIRNHGVDLKLRQKELCGIK
jgi:N-acyl-D-aspartate/D-glutamate deacylase